MSLNKLMQKKTTSSTLNKILPAAKSDKVFASVCVRLSVALSKISHEPGERFD